MIPLIGKNITYIAFIFLIVILVIKKLKNDTILRCIKEMSYYFSLIAIIMVFIGMGYVYIYKTFPFNQVLYYYILIWFIAAMIGCLPLMINLKDDK